MDSSAVAPYQQVAQGFLWQGLVPILVALAAYVCTYKIGEWRDRKKYSKLGVAIIKSLQEELKTGIRIMEAVEAVANNPSDNRPPSKFGQSLPAESWYGPQTISDEVLLRIIETTKNEEKGSLPVSDCRIHCKNYFVYMCTNYNNALARAMGAGGGWKQPFLEPGLLGRSDGTYLRDARNVREMLNRAREQLEVNAKRWIPR